jgi:hypothetical protein
MLDDGMQATGGGLKVKDVATLLVEAVERGQPRPADAVGVVPSGQAVVARPGDREGGRDDS